MIDYTRARLARPGTEVKLKAAESSRTTHGALEAVDACRYFAGLLVSALHGAEKETLLQPDHCPAEGIWDASLLTARIAAVAGGSFKDREPPEIRGTGYVVQTLEAALWAFHRSGSFRDGALLAVNLGDDADTTGAIYGQIAGAYYGADGIPRKWRERLTMSGAIVSPADRLWVQAESSAPPV